MSEMVERVARALYEDEDPPTDPWHEAWEVIPDLSRMSNPTMCKEYWRRKARAAIEAMLEPTQDMLTAMGAVPELPIAGYFAKTYYAAIDEALK